MNQRSTRQRLNYILNHFSSRAERQGASVRLSAQDIELLKEQCGFKDVHEIAFYIKALESKHLMASNCSVDHTILEASITIDGYCKLDELKVTGEI